MSAMNSALVFPPVVVFLLLTYLAAAGAKWDLLVRNAGVSAMHMQLLNTDRVVILDRTEAGPSNMSLPPGRRCLDNPDDPVLKHDCFAHSLEYDVASNTVRPLYIVTDTWCSSGAVMPDGTLMQIGGYKNGQRKIRLYKPCGNNACDWHEFNDTLLNGRWYATSHILPDNRQIIIGGRRQFNYEFYPRTPETFKTYNLPFLAQTNDKNIENNLYPFVFLNLDGNLFIYANNRAILFDYTKGEVVRSYPTIPGGDPRNYPSTGSAVLLPLNLQDGNKLTPEVLVCGGAPRGSYISVKNGKFLRALDTCARIRITDPNPQWAMETMPMNRVMNDMVLLPNGNVLIINGASSGTAGWENGRDPALVPVVYRPGNINGSRFVLQNPTTIPRMYHSTAVLLRDGRVLVGGSNAHEYYKFTGVLFPTELSLEAYSPDYLDPEFAKIRPNITSPDSHSVIGYGQQLNVTFRAQGCKLNKESVKVTMVAPPFATHAFSMNQRLLVLTKADVTAVGRDCYRVRVVTPNSGVLAPSGFYLLFVVYQEVPGPGIWVQIK